MTLRLELPRDVRAPGAARRAVDDLRQALDPDTADDARLLISELVTNSVQHGAGEKIVVLLETGHRNQLRCEVIDDGCGFEPRGRGDREIGGWGLDLVKQLAGDWGVHSGSTHVWFALGAARGPSDSGD